MADAAFAGPARLGRDDGHDDLARGMVAGAEVRRRAEDGVHEVLRVRDVGTQVEEGGDGEALVGDRMQRNA